jgi:hypothetical protein
MDVLPMEGRASLERVLAAINLERREATGFVAGYLESLAEDLILLTAPAPDALRAS